MSPPDLSIEDIPVEFMVDILASFPVKTIVHCKCVCKKWLNLISDSYFADLQLLRSPASLMIHHSSETEITRYHNPGILRWTEVEDKLNDPIMRIDLSCVPGFQNSQIHLVGSVNGFICLWQGCPHIINTYICSPITREYIVLPKQKCFLEGYGSVVSCFGISSVKQEYKVIRIFQTHKLSMSPFILEAEVYTLGTGEWRSLGHVPYWLKGIYGPFLNGHAHWTISDKDSPEKIYAFDFDKETFDLFPSPPSEATSRSLGVLKGCLCVCDNNDSKFTVWVMKEYGIKKSWCKEVVLERSITPYPHLLTVDVCIIDGPEDEFCLVAPYKDKQLGYCLERKKVVDMEIFDCYFKALAYNPSFYRLSNFENERVHVF